MGPAAGHRALCLGQETPSSPFAGGIIEPSKGYNDPQCLRLLPSWSRTRPRILGRGAPASVAPYAGGLQRNTIVGRALAATSGTRSTPAAFVLDASTNGPPHNASLAPSGRHTPTGISDRRAARYATGAGGQNVTWFATGLPALWHVSCE